MMDMKRVELIEKKAHGKRTSMPDTNVLTNDEFDFLIDSIYGLKRDFEEVSQANLTNARFAHEKCETIKQQQEALNGLAKLNEYLQSHPELSNNRIGDSVSLIAIDALERQREQIERYENVMRKVEKYINMDRTHFAAYQISELLGDTHE